MDLLIAIQENPLGTLEDLAKSTNASKPTVAKRLSVLEGVSPQKLLSLDPKEGGYFTVNPFLSYYNLGFEYFGLILETNSHKQTLNVEKMATKHPYTQYRARCYGASNGVLFQFRTPIGSRALIMSLVKAMIDNEMAVGYKILPSDDKPAIYSSLNAKGWQPESLSWKFDWEKWFELDGTGKIETNREGKPGKALSWLLKKDVYIIQESMRNARRKNKDIMDTLKKNGINFTPQTFSRRYNMIKEECYEGYRTVFDPTIFDVYNNVVITGQGKKSFLNNLRLRLYNHPIPFESTLRIVDNDLFWYVRLQATHLSKLLSALSNQLDKMSVSLLDYNHSFIYAIWPETYDEVSHKWKTDEDFMINDVLK